MFSYIWHTFFFDPIYNSLVFFINVIPGGDVGLAVVVTVVLVKVVLLPISIKAVKTQKIFREIEPKLKEIKEKHKDNREAQALAMMTLYRESGINPLAGLFLIILQIPIFIALYLAVYSGGGIKLPDINVNLLYSFIDNPGIVNMNFLGIVDVTERSWFIALLAGISQYYQVKVSLPEMAPRDANKAVEFKEELMRNMQLQMRYVMPALIFIVAYIFSAIIALYFLISSLVTILQEFYIRKHK